MEIIMIRKLAFPLLIATSVAFATPYIPLNKITTHIGETRYDVPQVDATYNHYFEFAEIAGFLQGLQALNAGVNFGGEREEESGGQYDIIETDNTLESIWAWSRLYELTGNHRYDTNIANAWVYANVWPAWLEGAGYYSAHNCAWALAAERKYREVTGDSSKLSYATSSANYILQTQLSFASPLNVMVTGWCCGNLYLYGEATGNTAFMDTACSRARQIMTWVEQNPNDRLAMESWAMSSGTFIWGICNSLFRRDPALGQTWLATYGPMVQVFEPTQPSWSNAWNVAYCNAQGAMYDVTGNTTYRQNHLNLTNLLLRHDEDRDGGIPSSAIGSQFADASWTTAYLAEMGCDRYISTTIDAGTLLVTSPAHHATVSINQPIRVSAIVGNWGTLTLQNVSVIASGAFHDTVYVNILPGRNQKIDFGFWTPTQPGENAITVTTQATGDSNITNNSDVSHFTVQGNSNDGVTPLTPIMIANSATKMVQLTIPSQSAIRLSLYDLLGRQVINLIEGQLEPGRHTLPIPSVGLPSGIYFLELEVSSSLIVQRFVITK
jgi:hypothetical protein